MSQLSTENSIQQNLEQEKSNNKISNKIAQIINSSEIDVEKKISKDGILSILKENKSNKKLAALFLEQVWDKVYETLDSELKKDKKLALQAIHTSSYLYFHIDRSLFLDETILQAFVSSSIKEWKSFAQMEDFFEKTLGTNKKLYQSLLEYYRQQLWKDNELKQKDFVKNLIYIQTYFPEIYNQIKEAKIFDMNGTNVVLNSKKLQDLSLDIIKDPQYILAPDKNLYIQSFVREILGLGKLWNKDIEQFFVESISDFIQKEIDKKQSQEKQNQIQPENEKNQEQNKKEEVILLEEKWWEDDFIESSQYILPNHYITSLNSWDYIVYSGNYEVPISKKESLGFTSIALKNYIHFYTTLQSLWLLFFWKKYRSGFQTLLSNKKWFDYMHGNWVTESLMLSVLNVIGKNIWIPQKEVLTQDGKTTNKWKCFQTLADAKTAFWGIKATGKINGEIYSDLWAFSNGAVENYLIETRKIDGRGWVNISNWK